jgi:hypothetical protein
VKPSQMNQVEQLDLVKRTLGPIPPDVALFDVAWSRSGRATSFLVRVGERLGQSWMGDEVFQLDDWAEFSMMVRDAFWRAYLTAKGPEIRLFRFRKKSAKHLRSRA